MKLILQDDNGRQVMSTRLETHAALELSAALALEAREEMREKVEAREAVEEWVQEFARVPEEGRRVVHVQNSREFTGVASALAMEHPTGGSVGPAPGCMEGCIGDHRGPSCVSVVPRATPGDRLE